MPEPTNTASAPNCITSAASAGVAMPPAENWAPAAFRGGHPFHQLERSLQVLGLVHQLLLTQHGELLQSPSRWCGCGARPPRYCPTQLALGTDHRGALGNPAQRFAQITRTADEGNFDIGLIDVVLFVGGRQHFHFPSM